MISPEILRRYPFFAQLGDEFLKELAMIGDEVVLADGVFLFHEGDEADALYVITRGVVDLMARLPGDQHIDIEQLVEGDMIGWSAICEPTFYKLSAVTPSGARLLRIEGQAMRRIMEAYPDAGYRMMCHLTQTMGKRLTNLRARFVSLIET